MATKRKTVVRGRLTKEGMRRARELMRMSQGGLAARLGITQGELSRKENGRTSISLAQTLAVRGILEDQNVWPGSWELVT